ncbi:MAG: tetratricopeptide repeat protein, partial [Candidatus Contendobacter sp.]
MSTTDNRQLRQSLLDTYEALPPLEQVVVQLLSVIYEEVGKTALADCARRCDAPQIKTKGFPQPGLMPLLERLVSSKLVIQANNQWLCHRLIVEDMTRRAVREGRFESMAKAVQEVIRNTGWSDSYFRSYRQALAGLRIAFYRGDVKRMQRILEVCARNYPADLAQYPPWLLIFNNPFDADNLRALPDDLLGEALAAIFAAAARHFEPADELIAFGESLLAENRCADALRYYLAEQALLHGEPAKARQYLGAHDTDYSEALRGWLAFLDGNDEQAIQHYEAALKLLRKRTGKRKIFFDHLAGVFFILALLASNTPARLRQALDMMAPVFDKGARYAYPGIYRHLWQVVEVQQGQLQKIAAPDLSAPLPALNRFFQLLVLFWLKAADLQALRGLATILVGTAQENGYHWFAVELTELVRRLVGPTYNSPEPSTLSHKGEEELDGGRRLVRLFQLKEPWEHALNALLELTQPGAEPTTAPANRLVWWISWHKSGSCTISPREQKRDARGQWTQGRAVALKRLHHAEKLEFLTPQDREICSAVREDHSGYYGQTSYEIDPARALPLLVGHPLVFWEDTPGVRVDLVKGEPELLITPQGSQWR